jgi:hypothetical protein
MTLLVGNFFREDKTVRSISDDRYRMCGATIKDRVRISPCQQYDRGSLIPICHLPTNRALRAYSQLGSFELTIRPTCSAGFTAAWGALLISDVILFVMTIVKAILVGRSGDCALVNVLLRDGMQTKNKIPSMG